VSRSAHTSASDASSGECRISLAGAWRRSIEGAALDLVHVPGGYPAVGECVLERSLDLDWHAAKEGSRFFLVTEGVLSSADFSFNGEPLGTAGPFATYRFEIPPGLIHQTNTISARVRDVTETLGPTPGRFFEAGLVRDIYLERRPATFIESVALRSELSDDPPKAQCTVEIALNGSGSGEARVSLREKDSGKLVASLTADAREPIRFEVERPRLWSPERPDLYVLNVEFAPGDGRHPDLHEETVGFRKIEVRGRDFYLNGTRLLLKGVCRHDFTAQHGYSVPPEVIRHDLAMIKQAGFNFARLVHAPHSRHVARLAAKIGLLVTEEPGPCWHDLSDAALAESALESLRRTVLRDRNCPSVLAWSLYNECLPNIPYAIRAAKICRELDPGCLITFADCHHQFDAVKEMMQAAELSYYGINSYSPTSERYQEIMRICNDRPLVFTEWGGWMGLGNPRQMKLYCDAFVRHSREEAEARIAGCCFWAWADYDERSRGGPANIDGWTVEGLLDRDGHSRPDLQALSMMCFEMDRPPVAQPPKVEVLTRGLRFPGNWQPVSLGGVEGDQSHLEREVAAARSGFSYVPPAIGTLAVAGIDFDCGGSLAEGLLLLGPGREQVSIAVERRVSALAFLGHVALAGGYPSSTRRETGWGKLDRAAIKPRGQAASHYEFVFDDGRVSHQLVHGLHLLRGNLICHWWLTDPQTPELIPAVQIELSPQFEVLRLNLWHVELDAPRYLREIRWVCDDVESVQALLAVSIRTDE
jgi:hypothetical protein